MKEGAAKRIPRLNVELVVDEVLPMRVLRESGEVIHSCDDPICKNCRDKGGHKQAGTDTAPTIEGVDEEWRKDIELHIYERVSIICDE